jgi:hypothetical protein
VKSNEVTQVTTEDPRDLRWSAYRYAAAEMDEEECAAFEARLADDQLAREAVEEAVELRGAVALALRAGVVERRRQTVGQRVAAWTAAAAVGAALAFVLWRTVVNVIVPSNDDYAGSQETDAATVSSSSLFLAWTDVRERTRNENSAAVADDWRGDAPLAELPDLAIGDDAGGNIPRWLMAAVEAENDRKQETP